MRIRDYQSRLQQVGVLYVDVYPYYIDERGAVEFLLFKRREDIDALPGVWQPICGKIREDEPISEAFLRQTRAKTGLSPVETRKIDFVNLFYDDYYDAVMVTPACSVQLPRKRVEIDRTLHQTSRWVAPDELATYGMFEAQMHCYHVLLRMLGRSNGD